MGIQLPSPERRQSPQFSAYIYHYSYIIVGGDMNIDVAKDNELCTLLH